MILNAAHQKAGEVGAMEKGIISPKTRPGTQMNTSQHRLILKPTVAFYLLTSVLVFLMNVESVGHSLWLS